MIHTNKSIAFIHFIKKHSLKILGGIGSVFGLTQSQAQVFEAPVDSVFGLPNDLEFAFMTSADLDGDGDLDLIITNRSYSYGSYDYTEILYFQNIGSPSDPLFGEPDQNLVPVPVLNAYSYVYFRTSELADLDGDGDFDLLVSQYGYDDITYEYHNWLFFENTGTVASPVFAEAIVNPFNLASPGYLSVFDLADIDNDGDLDFIGQNIPYDYYGSGEISFMENIGTITNPDFDTILTNPFGLLPNSILNLPRLGDLDNDGDMDLIVSNYDGNFDFFENTGTASNPTFAAPVLNPFNLLSLADGVEIPEMLDIDSDGDLDLLTGSQISYYQTTINFYKNNLITGHEEIRNIDLNVFPNPAADYVKIINSSDIKFSQVRLIDISGKLVFSSSLNSNSFTVDLSSYSQGSYVLLLSNSEQVFRETIIKK